VSSPKGARGPAGLLNDVVENVWFYWLAGYSDSGFGEDYFWYNGWPNYERASFASLIISSTDWQTYYYYGQLNWLGNTGNITLPVNTTLYATIITYTQDNNGTAFASLYNSGGGEGLVWITTAFTASGDQAILVPFNDEAVQTAAVTGLIQQREYSEPGSRGLPVGTTFNIHSNTGCPDGNGGIDNRMSCSMGTTIDIGPNSGGNQEPGAWWKFIIAHEIGHSVQSLGSGIPGSLNYTGVDNGHLQCRCDNVSTYQGHCLNSKETFTAGASEGFAQSYADRVFNYDGQQNATFVNYKEFQNSDTPSDFTYPPMAKDGYGSPSNPDIKWNVNKCSYTTLPTAVEYDWMRFHYRIAAHDTGSGGPSTRTALPDLFNIYKMACSGNTVDPCTPSNSTNLVWENLRSAAETYYGANDSRYFRFRDTGILEGVNQ